MTRDLTVKKPGRCNRTAKSGLEGIGEKMEKLPKNQRLRRLCQWGFGGKSSRKGNSRGRGTTQRRVARSPTDPDPKPGATLQDDVRLETPPAMPLNPC